MSPRQDMVFGAQAGLRAPTSAKDGSPGERAILNRQLRKLAQWEAEDETYKEMLAAAEATALAGERKPANSYGRTHSYGRRP